MGFSDKPVSDKPGVPVHGFMDNTHSLLLYACSSVYLKETALVGTGLSTCIWAV